MLDAININGAEHYTWGDGCDGWHLVKTENLSVIQERVRPGKSEQRHVHRKSRQFFDVLKGIATIEIENQVLTLHERDGIEVPPEVPHRLRNDSPSDLILLVISSPKSHGDRANV